MPNTQIFPSALVAILTLLPSPVLSQARTVDVRASVGYTYRLDDSPPYGWLGGGTVTVPRGVHSRFGVEGWYERWTPSTGQLIDVAKWNLLRYIPGKMRGAEDDKEETAKPFASL